MKSIWQSNKYFYEDKDIQSKICLENIQKDQKLVFFIMLLGRKGKQYIKVPHGLIVAQIKSSLVYSKVSELLACELYELKDVFVSGL